MSQAVIIGAGLTGLSAAYHLEQRGFYNYILFEKEDTPGGLCRSVVQDGFTFDYTGHLLHTSDSYFRQLIHDIIGLETLNTITRRSFIYSHHRYTRYPFQVNLFGLPEHVITECIEEFVRKPKKKISSSTSFYEWAIINFGKGIARHFFFPYQKKIFSYDIKKLSTSWTGRFVPSTTLSQMIKGAIADSYDESIGYNAQFLYPKVGGIYNWVEKLASKIKKPIFYNHAIKKIDLKSKTIYFENDRAQNYDILINTIPLDRFIECLNEPSHSSLKKAQSKLLCNSVINFNLGINHPSISDKHWIYFPEKMFPFYRLGFPHNFAQSMAPIGCSSLYGEFSYLKKPSGNTKYLIKKSIDQTKKVLGITNTDIITEKVIHIEHAYVIYDFWRDRNLPQLHKRLNEFDIYSIGRYGEWKYSSMQEAVLDGKKIAEQITIVPAKHVDISNEPLTTNSIIKQKEIVS